MPRLRPRVRVALAVCCLSLSLLAAFAAQAHRVRAATTAPGGASAALLGMEDLPAGDWVALRGPFAGGAALRVACGYHLPIGSTVVAHAEAAFARELDEDVVEEVDDFVLDWAPGTAAGFMAWAHSIKCEGNLLTAGNTPPIRGRWWPVEAAALGDEAIAAHESRTSGYESDIVFVRRGDRVSILWHVVVSPTGQPVDAALTAAVAERMAARLDASLQGEQGQDSP